MNDYVVVGNSGLTMAVALILAAAVPSTPISAPTLPPFLPAREYELLTPSWTRLDPRHHYRQGRPGRRHVQYRPVRRP